MALGSKVVGDYTFGKKYAKNITEQMIERILARCEQELEIRINESLISIEEVVEKIRKALEPMQWRLEVEL